MKQLSLALNIVLLAAVGFLYYRNFSSNAGKANSVKPLEVKVKDSSNTVTKIAYVDLDSLNEQITFFKQSRKELEQLQKNNEAELTDDLKQLEARQNSFVQKNANPTPEQIQSFRGQLMQEQEKIEAKKVKYSNTLSQKNFDLVERIRKELKSFFNEYNKEKRYQYILTTSGELDYIIYKDSALNITQEVIRGMNEKLNVKK